MLRVALSFPRTSDNQTRSNKQATLGGGIPKDKERIVVRCRAEAGDDEERQEFNICTMIGGVVESCSLDLIFGGYAEFYVDGKHPVHLTGYFMPEEYGDDSDDEGEGGRPRYGDEDDDDSDDDEDEDDEGDSDGDEDDFGVLEEFDEDSDGADEAGFPS
jgi:FK506-binding nuclear protein